MKTKKQFNRVDHCRSIAGKGGRALVAKHGRQHMSHIGRKGFEATARKYFRSEQDYKNWLAIKSAFNYWNSTGLPPKYDINGIPVFPTEPPPAPWEKGYTEF